MANLGDFLLTVYGPSQPFQTVRATIRQWEDCELAEGAAGGNPEVRNVQRPKGQPAIERPVVREELLDIWLQPADRVRLERNGNDPNCPLASVVVIHGDHTWERDREGHVEVHVAESEDESRRTSHIPTDIERHFIRESLREYFVCLDLEALGSVTTCGRDCIRIRAVRHEGSRGQLWPHWLPHGADEYEFHADAERGALLYIAGKHQGRVFEVCEVIEVAYDEPLDDSVFTYELQLGEQIRTPTPTVERMTIEAAASKVPFVVLVPQWLPASIPGVAEVMFHRESKRQPYPSVTILYRGRRSLWIEQCATAQVDVELSAPAWDQIELDGKSLAIADAGDGQLAIAIQLHGSNALIHSDLSREQLIQIATSLSPAT